ncbi:MAG TPA: D-alanine--D-alanine ligase family protein [Aggregatilinea sp.]|uniref:D-alanine--D-alanine ligase family protein n=1 Tax=Aggregatilinea sp. TaxID=2806333 RepID=UPI002C7D5C46|nr:D-alanine--D-alanine ligase family protein [Aggregatilinea sp.]HML20804.1 D-alanine--D-alanine ligase family protein [Aggregatilinea sp.]
MSASKQTVGVIFGSRSVEHDVSIVTAQQVMQAMRPEKYEVVPIYISRDGRWLTGPDLRTLKTFQAEDIAEMMGMKEAIISPSTPHHGLIVPPLSGRLGRNELKRLDVVFPVLHGSHGEDGTIQGLLELADVPYVGAGVMASAVTRDKIIFKALMSHYGFSVVDHIGFTRQDWLRDADKLVARVEAELGYPVFVKPATLGSSIGVAKADNVDELRTYVNVAANFDRRLLVEKAMTDAIEINCAVMGNDDYKTAPLEQPVTWQEFLTYEEKYMRGDAGAGMKGAERKIPAPISDELTQRIKQIAQDAFRAVDGRGMARVDFLVREASGEVVLNEINTIPGSMAFYLWQEAGMPASQVVDELLRLAVEAHAEKRKTTYNYKTGLIAHAAARGLKGMKK